jgi:hypothetical protein
MKLSEMRELVGKATPGPWLVNIYAGNSHTSVGSDTQATSVDYAVIDMMLNNIEKLLDVAEQVKKCLDLYEIKGNAWKKLSEKIEELERE